jgi:hypothetical protein
MQNKILIHVNRKYHVPLDNILKVKQTKRGKVYVYYIDEKTKRTKIAIAKQDLGTLLNIINTNLLMRGDKALLVIKEK